MKHPIYRSCVLLVEDVEKSKHFYNVVLGQKIEMDFGENVGFEGGLSIWEKDYALNLVFRDEAKKINVGTNSLEIYFETEDLENLYERLLKQNVTVIHPIAEPPWGQRAFRIRDPDGHIVEFGESMETTVRRLNTQGLSLEEIAKKSMMPMEFIKMALNKQ